MNISLSTGLYYKKAFNEILDIINAAECNDIELFLNQAVKGMSANDIKQTVEKRKMNVVSIHAPIRLFTDGVGNEVDFINECIGLCGLLDAKYIVTHDIFERDDEGNVYYDDTNHIKAMAEFKNSDKFIMTENMPIAVKSGCRMYDLKYMKDFVHKNDYKMTYDVGHAGTCGYDIIKGYELLKPYIRNIHLNDCADGIEHKILGQGSLPIKEFVKVLKDDGYNYPVTVEYDFDNKQRNDMKSDKEAIDALKHTMDFLHSI